MLPYHLTEVLDATSLPVVRWYDEKQILMPRLGLTLAILLGVVIKSR